jgi:hypothetical protein
MFNPVCSAFGIPARLHRNNQPVDNDFSAPEFFYRRYPFEDLLKSQKPYPENIYSVALSFRDGMSVNRGRYCSHPGDVLFNDSSEEHYHLDYGVVQLEVEGLHYWSNSRRADDTGEYTLEIVHEPMDCMYPHSSVYLKKNGNRTDGPKGGGLKMQIKRAVAKASLLKDLNQLNLPSR